MANLKQTEKLKLEELFGMRGGYVLDFTNASFQQFFLDTVKIDIYNQRFAVQGDSKARRMRVFWQTESDYNVGYILKELLDYWKTNKEIKSEKINPNEKKIFDDCKGIANRLLGINTEDSSENQEAPEIEFLKRQFDNLSIDNLGIDSAVIEILNNRIDEIRKNLNSKSSLSAIIIIGSVLEGLLLGIATSNMKEFNESPACPKNKDTGKPLPFHEWTLSNLIDVAHSVGKLGLDVKKFSHSLRDFRNYIHPYQQLSSRFTPDIDTAKISWQVLQAAISDLKKQKR